MSGLGLPKWQIIKKSAVFNQMFEEGIRLNSDHILLLFLESQQSRFGFAVSRKIRGAVKRNRAKRRLRELLRLSRDRLPENLSIVLVAKPGIEGAKFEMLNKEFLSLLDNLDSRESQ